MITGGKWQELHRRANGDSPLRPDTSQNETGDE
jgi:hypothetical protein